MKTLEIEIRGTASEVVVGSLSKEELNRIHEVMRENDLVDDDQYDYNSFYYDSYLVDEAEVCAGETVSLTGSYRSVIATYQD